MKKAIITLLAGVLCMGCFAACDTNESAKDDGQSTGSSVTGEVLAGEVTAEQWVSKLGGLDLANYKLEYAGDTHEGSLNVDTLINLVVSENKLSCHYSQLEEDEISSRLDEFTAYAIKVDGTVYACGEEDGAYYDWGVEGDEFITGLFEYSSLIEMMIMLEAKNLSEIVDSAKLGMSEYIYDTEKQLYYTISGEPYQDDAKTTYTIRVEVEFSEGQVYIRQIVNFSGATEGYVQECWSFENTVVDLPKQDELGLWLNGTMNGVCDECEEEKTTHYYDGSQGDIGKGEYCNACAYEKDPSIFTDGKCDDCGGNEGLAYWAQFDGEYCTSCATKRFLEELL